MNSERLKQVENLCRRLFKIKNGFCDITDIKIELNKGRNIKDAIDDVLQNINTDELTDSNLFGNIINGPSIDDWECSFLIAFLLIIISFLFEFVLVTVLVGYLIIYSIMVRPCIHWDPPD
jgi:hypothetical protein